MSKNRRNKLRKITVDGDLFNWSVTDFNHDGDGGAKFRIWKSGHLISYELIYDKIITPKDVMSKIKLLKNLGMSVRTKEGKIKI